MSIVRSDSNVQRIVYDVPRVDVLDFVRDRLQEAYPGAAVVGRNTIRQHCEFLDEHGEVLAVASVRITTEYESEVSR